MLKKNEIEIQFLSQSVNEAFARTAVSAFFSQLDPTMEALYDIKMAVSEAVTNSIIHGYEGNKEGKVTIRCAYEDQKVSVEVIDKGKGIPNVDEAMTALYTTSEEDDRAGLGFTVMQSMMDEVFVESKVGEGTSVKMKKSLG